MLTPHPVYLALGHDAATRASAYTAWLRAGSDEEDLAAVRAHLDQERALGDVRFQQMVERTLNYPAACRPRGRPKKINVGDVNYLRPLN